MTVAVSFLGVRGSFPCGDSDKIGFGGNTACVCICFDNTQCFIDAGSGINGLAKKINEQKNTDVYGLISHLHWDHISGLPAFLLALDKSITLHVYAGLTGSAPHVPLEKTLYHMMAAPFFPVPITTVRAALDINDFVSGDSFFLRGTKIRVQTAPLNHPNGATGYRLDYDGKVIAYVSDTEHFPDRDDTYVLELMKNADLVIYDATYTNAEWPKFVGWGHSTWEEGVRLAKKANVKQLALFHHAPEHNDVFLEKTQKEVQKAFPNAFFAREKTTITL